MTKEILKSFMETINDKTGELKLPIAFPLPTQEDLRKRFEALFGKASVCLTPLIHPIAEETERMICQLLRPMEEEEYRLTVSIIDNSAVVNQFGGHLCVCGYDGVFRAFKYCPQCGRKILWKKRTI